MIFSWVIFFFKSYSIYLIVVYVKNDISACGGKPADVFFVLDSSGSISTRNFRKELKFTEDVASMFDTKENQVPNIGMNLI